MALLKLSNGQYTEVDDEDFELLNHFSWHCNGHGYVTGYVGGGRKNPQRVSLHRFLLRPSTKEQVDHVDGNKLNNRRSNLRKCTQSENLRNRALPKNSTSGFKGVHSFKRLGNWQARIASNNTRHFLGYFADPVEAALAYDRAARKLHGKFAKTNFDVC